MIITNDTIANQSIALMYDTFGKLEFTYPNKNIIVKINVTPIAIRSPASITDIKSVTHDKNTKQIVGTKNWMI